MPLTHAAYEEHARVLDEQYRSNAALADAFRAFCRDLGAGSIVLDVGCAGAHLAAVAAEEGVVYCGCDTSASLLRIATDRIPTPHAVRPSDVRALSWPGQSFHGVWCIAVLQHLSPTEQAGAVSELVRVCQVGGSVAVSAELGGRPYRDQIGRTRYPVTESRLRELLQCSNASVESTSLITRPADGAVRQWQCAIARRYGDDASRHQCILCPSNGWPRAAQYVGTQDVYDAYREDALYLIPDIAPVVEGHTLVVSEEHLLSFGGTVNDSLRRTVIDAVQGWARALLHNTAPDGDLLIVEHAPSCEGARAQCVDHAHLHLVPLDRDALQRFQYAVNTFLPREGTAPATEGGVFLHWLLSGDTMSIEERPGETQLFRRLLCAAGLVEHNSWRSALRANHNLRVRGDTAAILRSIYCERGCLYGS